MKTQIPSSVALLLIKVVLQRWMIVSDSVQKTYINGKWTKKVCAVIRFKDQEQTFKVRDQARRGMNAKKQPRPSEEQFWEITWDSVLGFLTPKRVNTSMRRAWYAEFTSWFQHNKQCFLVWVFL